MAMLKPDAQAAGVQLQVLMKAVTSFVGAIRLASWVHKADSAEQAGPLGPLPCRMPPPAPASA